MMNRKLKRVISIILTVILTITSMPQFTFASGSFKLVDEVEVNTELIDEGMFYIPHSSFTVSENDDNSKYVFKVERKGESLSKAKVKLTMTDIGAKYGKDYKIKVKNASLFGEKVQNSKEAKSIDELLGTEGYTEYNYSDAIIDGSVNNDNILKDGETDEMSEDEKKDIIKNFDDTLNDLDFDGKIVAPGLTDEFGNLETTEINESDTNINEENVLDEDIDELEETETLEDADAKEEIDEIEEIDKLDEPGEIDEVEEPEEMGEEEEPEGFDEFEELIETEEIEVIEETEEIDDETLVAFNNTNLEEKDDAETVAEIENNIVDEDDNEDEEKVTIDEFDDKSEEETIVDGNDDESEEETIVDGNDDESEEDAIDDGNDDESEEETIVDEIATDSEIIDADYELNDSTEEVEFETIKPIIATQSLAEGYEMMTGRKSDRKKVKVDRDKANTLNPNSLADPAFMNDGVQIIEEELKSAYVILEFGEVQKEKLIEIEVLNDNIYTGERQIGFNLSSVDESVIAGNYSSFTLVINDDEAEAPTYIDFEETNYYPKDGYIEVKIKRSGALRSIATCMIDTEDITAIKRRDYSQVHSLLVFGMGVNERTVKIPVVSLYLKEDSTFKLKLQEAKGALIGEKGNAICHIRKNDDSFKFAEDAILYPDETLGDDIKLKGANNEVDASSISEQKLNRLGVGTADYNLTSIVTGNSLNLKDLNYSATYNNTSDGSYNGSNGDTSWKMYVYDAGIAAGSASCTAGFKLSNDWTYNYAGIQIKWSKDQENGETWLAAYRRDKSDTWQDFYNKDRETWSGSVNNYFFDWNNFLSHDIGLRVIRYGGCWRKSPTLNIEYIKPIYRMNKVHLLPATVPKLIEDDGVERNSVTYSRYADAYIVNSQSDGTGVTWEGQNVTVKLSNEVNNPFYISGIQIVKKDTGVARTIVSNKDTSATSLSFHFDNDFTYTYGWSWGI